jgi:DNA (cytosine-5)-methyltransferase 1
VSGLVLEGFAGPGGASEGMRQLGLDPIGVEWDEAACATRRAAGHRTIRADVASFPLEHLAGKVEGVWLSPPCPTLSSAGKGAGREDMPWLLSFLERVYRTGAWHDPWEWHQWKDARTPLSLEPVRWVLTLNPEWVCLEQVPEALPIWESIAAVLEQQGYSCWTGVLCAADHGVPQKRHRAVLLASRVRKVMPPEPTHAENPEPSLFGGELARWVSMDVALGWSGVDETAPTITGGGTSGGGGVEPIGNAETRRRITALRVGDMQHASVASVASVAPTLTTKGHNSAWLVDRRTISRGPGGSKVPTVEVPSNRPAPTLAQAEKWLRRPATTVCADPRLADPGHRDRAGGQPQFASTALRLTEEEGAILQGFRADYPWAGNKSARWQQIGNAVPPPLAAACVKQVMA